MWFLSVRRTLAVTFSTFAKCRVSPARDDASSNTDEGAGASWIRIDPTTVAGSFCQNRGRVYDATPSIRSTYSRTRHLISVLSCSRVQDNQREARLTAVSAFRTSTSFSSPRSSTRSFAESATRGTTLAKMSTAIKIDASGSNPVQP